MREIVFDTETTGLDPKTGDRMVEIGCVELVNRVPTGATYHAYFNPDRDMPEQAEAVHGLSAAFLSDKPRFRDKCHELLEFIADSPLVAHNAGFDFGFLNTELDLCGLEMVCLSRMIDTVALAKRRHPGAKLSLDALCTRYGIDRSHRVKHGALLDAELLAQVYVELTGGRQIGFALAASGGEDTSIEMTFQRAKERIFRPARPHTPTAAEIERHRAFIGEIEGAIWAA